MNPRSFEPNFRLEVRSADEGPVIWVGGELDSGTCDELVAAFRQALAEGFRGTLTLDLRDVSFIDSAGTRAVILIEREALEHGVSLALVAPGDEVTELLRTAGVIGRFHLKPHIVGRAIDASAPLERVELELPRDPQSPARARAEVRELLADRDQAEVSDVVLMASEIVTNAVVHPEDVAEPSVGLRIISYPEGVRIEVDDGGSGFDPHAPSEPRPDHGRGLFLVDRFASRWGTTHIPADRGQRFMVWFELDWRGAAA